LITLEGKKEIGGWYIEFGKENRTDWMKIFKDGIKKIMIGCQNFEQAIEEFNLLIEKFKKKYPYFIKKIEANKEKYFTFKKYPEEIRKYIYTTNACENINRQLEEKRIRSGGYFQSKEVVDINFYLIWENLREGRWKNPVINLKANEYEILQLFNLRFGRKEVSQTQNS
jgi:putative transposase